MTETNTADNPGTLQTKVSKKWLVRTIGFAIFVFIFGCWGLFDAVIAYPKRGINVAEKLELEYLRAAEQNRSLDAASIADPAGELAKLRERNKQQQLTSAADGARLQWLNALDTIGRASPEHTTIADPRGRKSQLEEVWAKKTPSEPLAAWDLPLQWGITFAGYGATAWLLLLIVMVKGKTYTWNPSTQALGLPGGASLTPADVEDFDKRRWDKFLIFLKIKASHAQLGGQELRLDLLRYEPLETWVLEMEKTAFPERALQAEKAAQSQAADAQPADSQPADSQPAAPATNESDKPAA
ncbi:MAG: hypothetical protein IT434_05380 [Phycisphaerales bacterium]|jgi:hypothetical protein|nr:hypothetical protein [Phycisphaerales bacterium]